jgi:hypothetical protein
MELANQGARERCRKVEFRPMLQSSMALPCWIAVFYREEVDVHGIG